MLSVWFPLLTTVFMLVVVIAVAPVRGHSMTKPERERLFFRQTYGLSIDRMLSESPLDRDEVRRLRDSGRRDGRVRAISTYENGIRPFGDRRSVRRPRVRVATRWIGNCALPPGRTFPPNDC